MEVSSAWTKEKYGTYFRKAGDGVFQRYNAVLGILSTYHFDHASGKVSVRQEQRIDDILDFNVMQQNEHRGFKGDGLHQATRIPTVEYWKIMKQCGFTPGQGYDERKFRQILNDRDNYKLKTVPGRI